MYSHMYPMHLRRGNEERGWELHHVPELGINASLAKNFTVERGTIFPLPTEYAQRVCLRKLQVYEDSMDLYLNNRDSFLALAIHLFKALNEGLKEKRFPPARRRIAMQIATNLALIDHALKSIPVYWIEPEVDELCQTLLDNFASMDKVCVTFY